MYNVWMYNVLMDAYVIKWMYMWLNGWINISIDTVMWCVYKKHR